MKRILFVCTGNTCRSSMAEALFNDAAAAVGLSEQYLAVSAGMSAFNGQPASKNSIKVLNEDWGIDLCSHRSKNISPQDALDAFLILTMTRSHKEALLSAMPELKPKVYTLKEFSGSSSPDISDPFGGTVDIYRKCAEEIKSSVDILVEKLKNITNS